MAERDLVKTLCIVSANLQHVDRVICNKHWWNFGQRYELATLQIELVPGHADLKIRLLNGRRLVNNEEDHVEVSWDTARVQSLTSIDELDQIYV